MRNLLSLRGVLEFWRHGTAALQASQTPGTERNMDSSFGRAAPRRGRNAEHANLSTDSHREAENGKGNVLIARIGRAALRRGRISPRPVPARLVKDRTLPFASRIPLAHQKPLFSTGSSATPAALRENPNEESRFILRHPFQCGFMA